MENCVPEGISVESECDAVAQPVDCSAACDNDPLQRVASERPRWGRTTHILLQIRDTTDRSKLFGSHGQRP